MTQYCDSCGPDDGVISTDSTIVCDDCLTPLTLSDDATQCAHTNCQAVSTTDPLVCDTCAGGHFRAYDTSFCYPANEDIINLSCPEGYITYQGVAGPPPVDICGAICAADEWLDDVTKDCTPCSDTIADCDRCEVEEGNVICTQCSGSLNPTWNYLACTTCDID